MSLLGNQGFLESLIGTGPDAQSNLFDVTFIPDVLSTVSITTSLTTGGLDELKNLISKSDIDSSKDLLSIRCQSFNIPAININTTTLPYQNTEVPKIIPGSSMSREFQITFRLDENYKLYSLFRRTLGTDSKGMFTFNKNEKWSVLVTSLKGDTGPSNISNPLNRNYLKPSYIWLFRKCYLKDLSQMNLNYDSSSNLKPTATFIYERYVDLTDVLESVL